MENKLNPSEEPTFRLPIVKSTTTRYFATNKISKKQAYVELFNENEELALWLRRRAQQLFPDLTIRWQGAILALELYKILDHQQTINGLSSLFTSPASSPPSTVTSHSPKANPPPQLPADR